MTPAKLGSLIGGAFGLVFVLVNTGGLPSAVALVLRIAAVAAFLAVLLAIRRPGESSAEPVRTGFSRGYWLVVAVEVVLIFVGLRVLNGPLDAPEAAVAWISCVVGAHFFGLAAVWRASFFYLLGAAMLACGLAGLVLAAVDAGEGPINLVGGVAPGALLLAFALWGTRRDAQPVR